MDFIPLLTRAFGALASRSFGNKAGLFCHGGVFLTLAAMDLDSSTSTLRWSLIASIAWGWTNDAIRARHMSLQEQPFAKCFRGITSFEVFFNVLFGPLSKQGRPDFCHRLHALRCRTRRCGFPLGR